MLRGILIGVFGLAVSACTIGLPTAVDAAPFEARMTEAPVQDGVYCGLAPGDTGQLVVRGQARGACAMFRWIAAERMVLVEPLGEGEAPMKAAPVDLGQGLFMLQLPLDAEKRKGKPFAFTLMAGMADDGVLTIFPFPSNGEFAGEVVSHPGVTFATHGGLDKMAAQPQPPGAGEPDAVPVDEMSMRLAEEKFVYIADAEPAAIRSLANSLVRRMVRYVRTEAVAQDVPLAMGLALFVRGEPSMLDQPPSAEQWRRIETLAAKVSALTD
jgi:hypothetical protein